MSHAMFYLKFFKILEQRDGKYFQSADVPISLSNLLFTAGLLSRWKNFKQKDLPWDALDSRFPP